MKNHQHLPFFQNVFFEFLCFCLVFFMNFHFFMKIKVKKQEIPTTSLFQCFIAFFCSKSFREPFFLSQDLCHLYRKKSLLKKKSKNHKMTPRRRCNLTSCYFAFLCEIVSELQACYGQITLFQRFV